MDKMKKLLLSVLAFGLIVPSFISPVSAQEVFFEDEIRKLFLEEEIVDEVVEEDEASDHVDDRVEVASAQENKNLVRNGDFELSEQAPTDPKYNGSNMHHDAGLWKTGNVKPTNWMLQMWVPKDELDNPEKFIDHFNAHYVTENDNSYIHMDMSTKPKGTMSFFKSPRVTTDKNTQYIWSADIKKVKNPQEILVRITRGGGSENLEHNIKGVNSDFELHYGIFSSGEASGIGLIFGFDNPNNGEFMIDNVSVKKYDGYPLKIEMVEDEISVRVDRQQKLNVDYAPQETFNKDLVWTSDDESVATVDSAGNVLGVGVGETEIKATSPVDNTVQTRAKVVVHNDDISIDTITIKNLDDTLNTEEKRFLDVTVLPDNTTEDADITWESSDSSIASFEGRKLVAKKEGVVTITAKHKDGTISDSKQVTINKRVIDDYAIMRDRWRDTLIGTEETMDLNDQDIYNFVQKLDAQSVEMYETMYKKDERERLASPRLWDSEQITFEADLTSQFQKLFVMSQAFMIEGTTLYQDEAFFEELIEAFHFMIDVNKFNGDYVQGNWWDWQIGVPQRFVKSLIVIDDYLNPVQRAKFIGAINGYIPFVDKQMRTGISSTSQPNAFVTATGANMTDIAISVLATGIIAKDESRLAQIPQHIPTVMGVNQTSSGDGFYTDGSFVQHQELAYTGSYGIEAIRGLANIVSIIDGTEWGFDETTPNYTNLYTIIPNSFFPIVHNGMVMGMTQGRSISRAPGTNRYAPGTSAAAELSANLLSLADYLPEDLETDIKEHVKYWYEGSKDYFDYVKNARDLEMLLNMKALLADETIEAQVSEELKVMSAMARVTNIRKNFSVGVAMTSDKIANYESINRENLYGFHTGDGMLYVYNDDLEMYGESFWPTVDWYRLPGITVDTRPLPKSALHRQKTAGAKWVGGVSNGTNGSAGMILDKGKQDNIGAGFDLKAKKSYFFIDDAIIAVGSDVSGTSEASIETIVENRILNENGTNEILVNGLPLTENLKQSMSKEDWVHLTGKDSNSDMGYYFLEDVSNMSLERNYRTGTYADINEMSGTNEVHRAHYFLMSVNHGMEVENDSYAYVMLPGASQEETAKEASSQSISIVKNDKNAHAVIDVEKGIFAANVFNQSETTLDLSAYDFPVSSITVKNAPAIVIEVLKNGELSIDISSPRNENDVIEFKATLKNNQILSKDDAIVNEVSSGDLLSFNFDSNNMRGMSNKVIVSYTESDELRDLISQFKTAKLEIDAKDPQDYTVASWQLMDALLKDVEDFNDRIEENGLNRVAPVTAFEVKEMLTRIAAVRAQLIKAGDATELKHIINDLDLNVYTVYAQGLLQELIDEAQDLFANRVDQDTLDTFKATFEAALDTYDKVIDLSKYNDILDIYAHIDVNKYKSDGVLKFTDAYRALQALVDAYDETSLLTVTVSELDTAMAELIASFESLELVDSDPVDPKLDELRKKAVQLILDISRLDKISDELRNEAGVLILMIEDRTTTYDSLLAQYNKVLELYKNNDKVIKKEEKHKDKDPKTGIETNTMSWILTLVTAFFVVTVSMKRKRKES